jgi:2-aminoadipate transaminase
MPGLRIGWVIAPQAVIEQMSRAKQAMDLHTGTFNQHLVLELLNAGYMEEMIPKLRRAYRERRDAMLDALRANFPAGSRWTKPHGGMFIFATLPPEVSASKLLIRSLQRNVAFVPGEDFYLTGAGKNTLRLNFTKTASPEIGEGIRRLAEALKSL